MKNWILFLVVLTIPVFAQNGAVERALRTYIKESNEENLKSSLASYTEEEIIDTVLHMVKDHTMYGDEAAEVLDKLDQVSTETILINLDSPWTFKRQATCKVLGNLKKEFPLKPLILKLQDQEYNVRGDAAQALIKIGEKTIPQLLKYTKYENYRMRANVCYVISNFNAKSDQLVAGISPLIHDKHPIVRSNAINIIAKTEDLALPHLESIYSYIGDNETIVTNTVVTGLRNMAQTNAEVIPFLQKKLASDTQNRKQVLTIIQGMESSGAVFTEDIIKIIENGQNHETAFLALNAINPDNEKLNKAFQTILQQDNLQAKVTTLDSVQHNTEKLNPSSFELVGKLLADPNEELRHKAINLLIYVNRRKYIEPCILDLISALDSQDEYVQAKSMVVLGHSGEFAISAVPRLMHFLKTGTEDQQLNALEALRSLYVLIPSAREAYALALKSSNRKIVREAVLILTGRKRIPASSIPGLIALLSDKDSQIRTWSIEALKNVPLDTRYVKPVIFAFANRIEKTHTNNSEETHTLLKSLRYILNANNAPLENGENIVRQLVPLYKNKSYRHDALANTGYLLSSAKVAIPELKELLTQELTLHDRANVMWVFGKTGITAKEVLPQVIEGAQHEQATVRYYSLWALGEIGAPNPKAIQVLEKYRAQAGREKWEATIALAHIDIAKVSDQELCEVASCEYKHLQVEALKFLYKQKGDVGPIINQLIETVLNTQNSDDVAYHSAKIISQLTKERHLLNDKLKSTIVSDVSTSNYTFYFNRAYMALVAGCFHQVVRIGEEVLQKYPDFHESKAFLQYNIACAYSLLSQTDKEKQDELASKAIDYLRKSTKYGDISAEYIEKDEDLFPLRNNSDFQQILRDLKKMDRP